MPAPHYYLSVRCTKNLSCLLPPAGVLGNLPDASTILHMPTFNQPPHVPIVAAGLGQEGAIHPGYDNNNTPQGSTDGGGVSSTPLSIPGIPAVPQKLAHKILAGDYLEMAELLPDSWRMEELLYQQSSVPGQCPGPLRPRKRPVTDILTWMECFAVMAAIITSKNSEKASQLFAYSRTIVRASQIFEGPAWVSYDSQFRRKAAALKSWDWGTIDAGLYNECFTGRAKTRALCKICLSDSHLDSHCPLLTQTLTTPNQIPGSARYPVIDKSRMVELCGLFNKPTGNECKYSNCRYAHIARSAGSDPTRLPLALSRAKHFWDLPVAFESSQAQHCTGWACGLTIISSICSIICC